MGISSALSTAVSGLNTNQSSIDVIGNNLANTNTTGFKAFRNEFVNNLYNTVSLGSAPSTGNAGTNPRQIGQGAAIGSIGVDFRPGTPTQTGIPSDLFIQGSGFFSVRRGNETLYTRDGAFRLNSLNQLVTSRGEVVQGFGVDQNFQVRPGTLVDLNVPLGSLTIAQATTRAFLQGTLDADAPVARSATTVGTNPGAVPLPGGAATAVSSIVVGSPPRPLFSQQGANTPLSGPVRITYTPVKGNQQLAPATFIMNPTDTIGTFMNNVFQALGINNATGQTPPAGLDFSNPNEIRITGNLGTNNDFAISPGDFQITGAGADGILGNTDDRTGSVAAEFAFANRIQTSDGDSVLTTFPAYDSLGSPVAIQARAYLESRVDDVTTYRFLFESRDNDILAPNSQVPAGSRGINGVLGTTTLSFGPDGRLIDPPSGTVPLTVSRANVGSTDISFNLDVTGISSFATDSSRLAVVSQDGIPAGSLIDYGVDASGVVIGTFDTGATRNLGQVALARFSNPAGLVAQENNLYRQGPNSGLPFTTEPGTNGLGTILSGSLELSNVDIAQSFVQLLQASTNFSANSRVISTAQELAQTLLSLPRS
jgi:flagellar hook protein FlgE